MKGFLTRVICGIITALIVGLFFAFLEPKTPGWFTLGVILICGSLWSIPVIPEIHKEMRKAVSEELTQALYRTEHFDGFICSIRDVVREELRRQNLSFTDLEQIDAKTDAELLTYSLPTRQD